MTCCVWYAPYTKLIGGPLFLHISTTKVVRGGHFFAKKMVRRTFFSGTVFLWQASHSIWLTSSTPVWTHPIVYQEAFRAGIQNLLELTFFLFLVKHTFIREKEGWRNLCSFRKLNAVTEPEPFMMPSVDYVIAQLSGARFLSKLDLLKGFH